MWGQQQPGFYPGYGAPQQVPLQQQPYPPWMNPQQQAAAGWYNNSSPFSPAAPPPYAGQQQPVPMQMSIPSGVLSHQDPYNAYFNRMSQRKPVLLCDGEFIAEPVWAIRRASPVWSQDEIALANKGAFRWTPKNSDVSYPQRCPYISVDNFVVLYNREMRNRGEEPKLVLGIWSKPNVEIHGVVQAKYEGVVLAGGGYYERSANKVGAPAYGRKWEEGDMSALDAANKELTEEVGINKKQGVHIVTRCLGYLDDPTAEPRSVPHLRFYMFRYLILSYSLCLTRSHYFRLIYLRWVEQEPRASAELKTIVTLPISQIVPLCKKQFSIPDPTQPGKSYNLILKHDRLLRLIMEHPETMDFLTNVSQVFDQVQPGVVGPPTSASQVPAAGAGMRMISASV